MAIEKSEFIVSFIRNVKANSGFLIAQSAISSSHTQNKGHSMIKGKGYFCHTNKERAQEKRGRDRSTLVLSP